MVSTASTNALPMNCPWRNKLSPSPRPRRGVHIVKVCPVDNIYLLCYTATCLSSIAGAGYSSPFPSHQGVHTRWFGRALEWHSRGQRFDPAYLHQKHSISFEIECFFYTFQSVLCWAFSPWTTNGQQTFLISSFLLREGSSYGVSTICWSRQIGSMQQMMTLATTIFLSLSIMIPAKY